MSQVFFREGRGHHSGLPTPARPPTLSSMGEGQNQHRKGWSLGLMHETLDVEPGTRVSMVDPKPWHGHGGGDMARQRPTLSLPF